MQGATKGLCVVLIPCELVWPHGKALGWYYGKQKDIGSIRFGSPFSSLHKLWFMDAVL